MKELISVIVPIYNVQENLKRCIESIVQQTYKNLEIILIDDGSSDDSGIICDNFAKLDKRIIVIHQKNQGPSNARNTGLKISKGKYIGFVDGDDYIDSRMYELLYNNLIKYKAQISTCDFEKVYSNVNLKKQNIMHKKSYAIDNSMAIKLLLEDKIINNYVWNKLYIKELWNNEYFPDKKKFEDLGTIYKILQKAKKVAIYRCKLYKYVINENSITNNIKDDSSVLNYIEMTNTMLNFVEYNYPNFEESVKKARCKYIINWHTMCIKNNLKNLYDSDTLIKQYSKFEKIIKEYGIIKSTKYCNLKHKIIGTILYFNRKCVWNLGQKKYRHQSVA